MNKIRFINKHSYILASTNNIKCVYQLNNKIYLGAQILFYSFHDEDKNDLDIYYAS